MMSVVTSRAGVGAMTVLVVGLAACSTDVGTAGCEPTLEVPLPGTPLTLLRDARLIAVGTGFLLIGSDGTEVRWATLAADGTLGAEQSYLLPQEASAPFYAVSGAVAPEDTVLVGFVSAAGVQLVSVPADGSPAGPPGSPVVTAGGGATSLTAVLGTSRTGTDAGLTWLDPVAGTVGFAFVNGLGELSTQPIVIDTALAFACLAVSSETTVPGADFLVSFLRYGASGGVPTWEKAEMSADGGIATLSLDLAVTSTTMGCARGTPMTGLDYSLAWQDYSGSWLSAYSAPKTDAAGNVLVAGSVKSYPFVSATDFGGPDLQPPIVGLAAFAGDYGVVFARPTAVELWRVTGSGSRRSGALVFPSLEGDSGERLLCHRRGRHRRHIRRLRQLGQRLPPLVR